METLSLSVSLSCSLTSVVPCDHRFRQFVVPGARREVSSFPVVRAAGPALHRGEHKRFMPDSAAFSGPIGDLCGLVEPPTASDHS